MRAPLGSGTASSTFHIARAELAEVLDATFIKGAAIRRARCE